MNLGPHGPNARAHNHHPTRVSELCSSCLHTGDITCWEKKERERHTHGATSLFSLLMSFSYISGSTEKLMIIRCQQIGRWQTKAQRQAIFLPSPFLANLFCSSPSLLSLYLPFSLQGNCCQEMVCIIGSSVSQQALPLSKVWGKPRHQSPDILVPSVKDNHGLNLYYLPEVPEPREKPRRHLFSPPQLWSQEEIHCYQQLEISGNTPWAEHQGCPHPCGVFRTRPPMHRALKSEGKAGEAHPLLRGSMV